MEKIFVLGAGTMGSGIVQAFAQKGYEVIVRDIKDELVQSGIVRIKNPSQNALLLENRYRLFHLGR